MILYCEDCESKVDAVSRGSYNYVDNHIDYPVNITLFSCPICEGPMLTYQELEIVERNGKTDQEWGNPVRIWPSTKNISAYIPKIVRSSLEEANKCFEAKAYSACAVMCGRVLEAIGIDHKIKSKFLAGGLKELLDKKIIDNRLYEWGQELRKHRNLGAHASGVDISKEDANDLYNFADAICNYIYVLSEKFSKFMKRKDNKEAKVKVLLTSKETPV